MKPAVAVMARVPGAMPVKSRLHGALTAERATALYRCVLLDRLDALARAARTLADGAADVVLGPCDDGGDYLVGVRVSRPALFEDIPWSTDAVLATTLARARTLGARVVTLPAWFDVDTDDDLVRLHTAMRAAESPPARTFAFVEAPYG
ncbi:MAG: DUF2064 domain-containing protein [Candidatus Rokuibacteriota bacterium]